MIPNITTEYFTFITSLQMLEVGIFIVNLVPKAYGIVCWPTLSVKYSAEKSKYSVKVLSGLTRNQDLRVNGSVKYKN